MAASTAKERDENTLFNLFRNDIRFRLLNLHILLALFVVGLVTFFTGYARNQLEIEVQRNDIALAQALALEVDRGGQSLGESSQNIIRWMDQVWGDQIAVVTVVDQNGQNVMQLRGGTSLLEGNDWQAWSSWQRDVVQFVLAEGSGSFFSAAPDNARWVHSFVTTPQSDSRVIIQRPADQAFATLRIIFQLIGAALALYILFIIIFWYRLSNTIITPLQNLETFSAKITGREITSINEDEAPARLAQRSDQIGKLASALSKMGEQYLITDGQLVKQTGRLEAILESMDAGLVLENMQGTILYCNRQASSWLGVDQSEITGHLASDAMPELIEAQAHPQFLSFINSTENDFVEISRKRPDGKLQNLNLQRFKVKDDKGNMIGTGQIWHDVTNYREMDRMKSALISTVSHELRTPLTSIIGYSDSLISDEIEWDDEKRNRFIWHINNESRRLKKMIEGLLDFTRLEGGRLKILMRPADLNSCVIDVLDSMEIEKTVRLDLDLSPDLPGISADCERLKTVIRNLIENALKYGYEQSNIMISTRSAQTTKDVLFSVQNAGPPLKQSDQEKLFEPFFRLDTGYDRHSSGVGLGLAISRGFIEAHGGRIWYESDELGTNFIFSLPRIQTAINHHQREKA